jgi:hypothetical protein
MSKTKMIAAPTEVQQAEIELRHAQAVREQLKIAMNKAELAVTAAVDALFRARKKSDLAGPLAMFSPARDPSGKKIPHVIVRRTAATIWTRPVGSVSNLSIQQWRKSKVHGGAWTEFPSGHYYSGTLSLPDEAA